MGLSFTDIVDKHGSAIYFIHDGSEQGKREILELRDAVVARTSKQTEIFSLDDQTGRAIVQFYSLRGSKFVLIVRDDDQLHKVWSDGELFDPSQIAYTAEQAG